MIGLSKKTKQLYIQGKILYIVIINSHGRTGRIDIFKPLCKPYLFYKSNHSNDKPVWHCKTLRWNKDHWYNTPLYIQDDNSPRNNPEHLHVFTKRKHAEKYLNQVLKGTA